VDVILESGEVRVIERPGEIIVYVDIETKGFTTDNAIFTDKSFELRVGGEIHLLFRYVDVRGTIMNIEYEPITGITQLRNTPNN
jgi:hypothetical protein